MKRSELSEFEPVFEAAELGMGFVPNSLMTMGRKPKLLKGFAELSTVVLNPDDISMELTNMIGLVTSNSSGCTYCQAHMASFADRVGVSQEKLDAIWDMESSSLFSEAEKAALRVARDAGLVPNATTDDQFAELKQYYSEDAILEIVAVIALFGWLNRRNDTMATELESSPFNFGREKLTNHGWDAGKHEPGE